MRTSSYTYHVARRDALAHGMLLLGDPTPDHGAWTAEAEDYNALCDAFTVYTEQEARDYRQMSETMAYAQSNGHWRDHHRMLAFMGV